MPIYYGQLQRRIAEERAEYASRAERTGPIYHCVYRPHNIECHDLAEYKLIESDTGKEYYSCERHISQYRDLNERCGYEKFVIVPIMFKRKRAEEQQGNARCLMAEMSADQFYMYKWRDEHANEVIDLPMMLAFADAFNAHQTAEMRAERNKPYNSSVELVLEREARERAEKALREATDAIRWVLGSNGDFTERKAGQGPYWWRTELRERSERALASLKSSEGAK